jgi:hypothetical protein
LIIEPSICAPSDVVKEKSSVGEYSWVASHSLTAALFSIVRSFPRKVDHTSTCDGWCTADQRSMKYVALGAMSM